MASGKSSGILQGDASLGLVYANGVQIEDDQPIGISFDRTPQSQPVDFDSLLREDATVSTSSAVVLRKAVLEAGLFDEHFRRCEDFDLWLLVYPDQNVGFTNIEKLIPGTSSQSNRALKATPRPPIIKTHEHFDHRYRKMIYIVRDPQEVALSYYDFQRKYMQIEEGYPLEQYVDDFVAGRLISLDWGT